MEPHSVVTVERNPAIQEFAPGDTVRVGIRIREGDRERVQVFQGVVIALKGRAPGTTFTVRRVSYGIGIERTFPLYSPLVERVEVVRRGDVRQSNLYYLRGRYGRAARIKERAWTREKSSKVVEPEPVSQVEPVEEPVAEAAEQPEAPEPVSQVEPVEEPVAEPVEQPETPEPVSQVEPVEEPAVEPEEQPEEPEQIEKTKEE